MQVRTVVVLAAALSICLPSAIDQSFDAAGAAAQARLQAIVDTRNTPGASAAVAVDGRIVWKGAAGVARIEEGVAATPQTRFGLGSISKTLTMAGVMRLVDAGVIDLDAPVEKYLTDYPHKGRGVTVRRIAVHQAGLSDVFENANRQTRDHYGTVDAAYQRIKGEPLEFEPGTGTEYRTASYTVIARVMEAAAGRPYLEIMREQVFEPLGLTSIVPNDPRVDLADRVRFYLTDDAGAFVPGPYFDPSFKLAGAGFIATAEDIARFGAALAGGPFLSDRARREMLTPVPMADGTPTEWALGIRAGSLQQRPMFHLPGGGIGISTWLFVFPEQQVSIAVLTNVPTGAAGGRTRNIIAGAFLEALEPRVDHVVEDRPELIVEAH